MSTGSHWFFPHERWLIPRILRRQREKAQAASARLDVNLGPLGRVLYAAGLANGRLGFVFGAAGFICLFVSGFHGLLLAVGYGLAAVGILFESVGLVRSQQKTTEGERFRGGRPYQRRRPDGS